MRFGQHGLLVDGVFGQVAAGGVVGLLSPAGDAAQELVDAAGGDVAQVGAQREHPVEIGQGAGDVAGEQAVAFDAEQVGQFAVAEQSNT